MNLDLTDATLDAVLTLERAARIGAAATVQPAVMVMLKGPLVSPKRSVDTNLMKSWLTLRAVEQQSRQLEAMERAAREAAMPQPEKRRDAAQSSRRGSDAAAGVRAGAFVAFTQWSLGRLSAGAVAAAGHDPGGAEAASGTAHRWRGAAAVERTAEPSRRAELKSASASR